MSGCSARSAGPGGSDKPNDPSVYRLPAALSLLDDVVEALEVSRFTIVGLSLGGLIAAHCTASRGDRVAAQTLVAPAGLSPKLMPFFRLLGQPIIGLFLAAPPKALLRQGLPAVVRQKQAVPDALVDLYHRYRHMPGAASALVQLIRQGTHHGEVRPEALLASKLQDCTAPTLFVLGANDPIVSRRPAEALAQAMPKASLWVVPECGHGPLREYPEAFSQRLLTFLKENYPH